MGQGYFRINAITKYAKQSLPGEALCKGKIFRTVNGTQTGDTAKLVKGLVKVFNS